MTPTETKSTRRRPGDGRETLREVWRQAEAWDSAAISGKSRQEAARRTALFLGFLGALAGAVGGTLGLPEGSIGQTTLAVGAAVLIALGGYFAKELLTTDREAEWAFSRLLSEALRRECWLYLLRAAPYATGDATSLLAKRSARLVESLGVARDRQAPSATIAPPVTSTIADYVDDRVLDQAAWYEKRALRQRGEAAKLRRLTILLGALAVVASAAGATFGALLVLVPLLTTGAAAVVAWTRGTHLGATIALYQQAATQLRFEVARWRDREEPEDVTLVERCEAIMAQENGSWRAEWIAEEEGQDPATSAAQSS